MFSNHARTQSLCLAEEDQYELMNLVEEDHQPNKPRKTKRIRTNRSQKRQWKFKNMSVNIANVPSSSNGQARTNSQKFVDEARQY
ncbi:hypothetical protein B9Z55_023451 [Caenorhabditis nigoni]|uniref:Uncharacterized protein n=1 Tax=Caenorhabditis nigoni TaxID=1611254 RepID=A0A2G5SQ44_9PELO|nr:hypothetical protein B9Z55_023451 [Caenorhabditis nigoni]